MSDIFDKFDKQFGEEVQRSIEEAKNNSGDYEKVPHGSYEVAVKQMELKESKSGKPMVSIWFKVLDGTYKNQTIFYNQVVVEKFQFHFVSELIRKMVSKAGENGNEIVNTLYEWFDLNDGFSYKSYNDLILDVFELTKDFEYGLKFEQNKKNPNFDTYEITDVFTLE